VGKAGEPIIGRDGSPSRPTSLDGRLGKTSAIAQRKQWAGRTFGREGNRSVVVHNDKFVFTAGADLDWTGPRPALVRAAAEEQIVFIPGGPPEEDDS
jgi:hypothetical protein